MTIYGQGQSSTTWSELEQSSTVAEVLYTTATWNKKAESLVQLLQENCSGSQKVETWQWISWPSTTLPITSANCCIQSIAPRDYAVPDISRSNSWHKICTALPTRRRRRCL